MRGNHALRNPDILDKIVQTLGIGELLLLPLLLLLLLLLESSCKLFC